MTSKKSLNLSALTITGLFCFFVISGCGDKAAEPENSAPVVVITDMEPDDRIALHLVIALFPKRTVLIGTTVMHSYRKKLLAERLMHQLKFTHVPVIQGSGGQADDYPDIASSRAGREYDLEGTHILERRALREMANHARSSKQLQIELRRILSTNQSVEIIVLAPPTDLATILDESPELAGHISRVHLMGGWVEIERPNGIELRSTYNWNMDPQASRNLLESPTFPITLYSSHAVKRHFSGGSLQRTTFPNLIEMLEASSERLPSVAETCIAGSSWDNHLMDRIPELENVLGRKNAGMQFSPADPVVVVGAFAPALIKTRTPIRVRLDEQDLDPGKGYRIFAIPSPDSRIELVEAFDEAIFREVFADAFRALQ
jgi:hypothetical protein